MYGKVEVEGYGVRKILLIPMLLSNGNIQLLNMSILIRVKKYPPVE
jgi:hypothetical protein